MGGEIIIFVSFFTVVFGIFYLYYSARNRERLALIEKGADASIFYAKKRNAPPVWKVITINLGLLLMFIGFGILTGMLIEEIGGYRDALYPAIIFLFSGGGLLTGFFVTKKYVD